MAEGINAIATVAKHSSRSSARGRSFWADGEVGADGRGRLLSVGCERPADVSLGLPAVRKQACGRWRRSGNPSVDREDEAGPMYQPNQTRARLDGAARCVAGASAWWLTVGAEIWAQQPNAILATEPGAGSPHGGASGPALGPSWLCPVAGRVGGRLEPSIAALRPADMTRFRDTPEYSGVCCTGVDTGA
jgi:hypothetical protein